MTNFWLLVIGGIPGGILGWQIGKAIRERRERDERSN